MRIAAYVPTRGRVWWETAARCSQLWAEAHSLGHELSLEYAQGNTGVVEVRNMIMDDFLSGNADVLLMVDDDVVPGPDVLRICVAALDWKAIVAAPCPVARPGTTVLPNMYLWDPVRKVASTAVMLAATERGLVQVDMAGFGCVAVARPVCAQLKHFKVRQEKNRWVMGEDMEFCLRAKSQGFQTWVDMSVPCEHMLELHGNSLAIAYGALLQSMEVDDDNAEERELLSS